MRKKLLLLGLLVFLLACSQMKAILPIWDAKENFSHGEMAYVDFLMTLIDHGAPLREAQEAYNATGCFPISFSLSRRVWDAHTRELRLPADGVDDPELLLALRHQGSALFDKVVGTKKREWAQLIPGKKETYIYNDVPSYMAAYAESWKAWTWLKAGYDCWRHIEIMAAGTIPVFRNSYGIPNGTMFAYPKKLMGYVEANQNEADPAKLVVWRELFLSWGIKHLQSSAMISYMAQVTHVDLSEPSVRVAFLDENLPKQADYLSMSLLIGLVELLGHDQVDIFYPVPYLYEGGPEAKSHWGAGFNYAHMLTQPTTQRSFGDMVQDLSLAHYTAVIFGSITRSKEHWDVVVKSYAGQKNRVWVCEGEDQGKDKTKDWGDLSAFPIFVRELRY